MGPMLERKFNKVWQKLKGRDGVKSAPWFKKADTAVCKKFEAYQKALATAKSGSVDDLLKLGKALRDLEAAITKHVELKAVEQIDDDHLSPSERKTLVMEVNRLKAEVRHDVAVFESRLRAALSAADKDLKTLESIEAGKKKELWKGFGVDL